MMDTLGNPTLSGTPRFRASAETRMAALRVRVLMAGHSDWQRTVSLLARLERLGRHAGAAGIVAFASSLRRELTATCKSQVRLPAADNSARGAAQESL